MLTIFISVGSLLTLTSGQSYRGSSQDAAILSDARYLAGDGTFGAAYTQEDGVQFKEESDANGDRKGSYSYVDPTGHRRTVFYTAGKNGFQVRDELEAIGDHIPTAAPVLAPQPEYEPLPEYNPPDYRPPVPLQRPHRPPAQPHSHYAQESIYEPQPESRYYSRPQYRPPQTTPSPPPQFRPQPQAHFRPLLAFQPEPQRDQPPPQFQYQSRPQFQPHSQPRYNDITTSAPHRFYPPGKLDFNRTPDGFSYTFNKS